MFERIRAALSGCAEGARRGMRAALARLKGFGFGREQWRRLGAYAALAALLATLGAASSAYRARRLARPASDPPARSVLSVRTEAQPDPSPTPAPAQWVWPLEGEIVGSYAPDAPVWSATLAQWQTHPALDIAGSPGEAVYACADGVVADAYCDRLWGNVIVLEHADGYRSTCAGLNTIKLIELGALVKAGDIISAVGPSLPCEADLPAHIHFELTQSGEPVDFGTLIKNG